MATKVAVRYTPTRSSRQDEDESKKKSAGNGKNGKGVKPATIALAAAGVAAAAGAVYFLAIGERGARNREKLKGWAVKAKGEVMEKIEQLKHIDAEKYGQIVDTVMRRYKGLKKADVGEIASLGKELKDQWDDIKDQASSSNGRYSNLRRVSGDEE